MAHPGARNPIQVFDVLAQPVGVFAAIDAADPAIKAAAIDGFDGGFGVNTRHRNGRLRATGASAHPVEIENAFLLWLLRVLHSTRHSSSVMRRSARAPAAPWRNSGTHSSSRS